MTGFVDESEVADRKYVDHQDIPALPDWFGERARELAALKVTIKAQEARSKELSEDLLAAMATMTEERRISVDNIRLTRAAGSNTRIDPKILLSKGVQAAIIAEATIRKDYEYVLIRTVED